MKVDWRKLKAEYVSDWHTSTRSLAQKYGLSNEVVFSRSAKDGWVKARMQLSAKTEQKLSEVLSDELVDERVRLMKEARFVAGRGLAGIARIQPKTARESKELWESGAGLQAKILGFDKTGNNTTINNNLVSVDALVVQMQQRKEAKQNG